jgi:Ser/Thr protein kinase RdoA (MazF antagonist)
MTTIAAPYAGLTPDRVLDALDTVGIHGDGRMLSLNSYENRVYQCWCESAPSVVAKFYRPARWSDEQIREEHAFVDALAQSEIPAVPALEFDGETLHRIDAFRFAVYPLRGGRAPMLDRRDTLLQLGRFLGRMHLLGEVVPFRHRIALSVEGFGDASRDFLLRESFLPPELADVYRGVANQALAGVRAAFDRAGAVRSLRLHGDCHAGNIMWTDAGPHFVDFDDAMMGPSIQDLWMLLSGERQEMEAQLSAVLEGYETFRSFDRRELHLVEALRTLRLIHYAAWIARRWHDPAFPAAFPWFNTQRYWQDRILELREQISAMDEPPLVA